MRLVWYISIGMTLAGVAMIVAGQVFNLDEFVTLAGMLTLVAGIAKVVIAGIWSSMFSEPVADDRSSSQESRPS